MDARAVQLLRSARDLVDRGWVQGTDARSAAGGEVDPWDGDAAG